MSVKIRPYKGKEGIYEYDICFELPDGTQVRERKKSPISSKDGTKRWAAQRERELYTLALSGELQKQEIPTVEDFAERWIEGHYKAEGCRPSTIQRVRERLRVSILPRFGTMRLDQITAEDLARFVGTLQERIRPRTILAHLGVITGMLKKAVEWKLIKEAPKSPSVRLDPLERNVVDPRDFEPLVSAAAAEGDFEHALILLLGEMGMRAGEVMGLWWDCVNFHAGTVTVKRNLVLGKLGPPKNRKTRTFKVTARTLAALKRLRHLRSNSVFARENGTPPSPRALDRILERIFRRARLTPMGPHALRHCALTRMAVAGVPIHVIRQISGHGSLQMLENYLHSLVDSTQVAVDKLEQFEVFSGGSTADGEMLEKAMETGSDAPSKRALKVVSEGE